MRIISKICPSWAKFSLLLWARCGEKRGTGGDETDGDDLPYAEPPESRPGVAAEVLHAKAYYAIADKIRGACVAAALDVERKDRLFL